MKKISYQLLLVAFVLFVIICFLISCGDKKCTVSFDSDGGSVVEAQEVKKGEKATKPTDPTKNGYTFFGWFLNDEEWNFAGHVVTEDMTLKAKWVSNNSSDGVVVEPDVYNGAPTDGLVIKQAGSRYGEYYYVNGYTGSSSIVKIPSTYNGLPIKRIEGGAFMDCSHITKVIIGDGIEEIYSGAFRNCTSLSSITIGKGVKQISSQAFDNTAYYNNTSNWENGVLYVGKYLVKANKSIGGHYSIKNGTLTIASSAFDECASLTSVSFPEGLKNIGPSAFRRCSSLYEIDIPDSVEFIGEVAFAGCTDLVDIQLGNGLISIGYDIIKNTAYHSKQSNWDNGMLYVDNYLLEVKEDKTISGSYAIKPGTRVICANAFSRQKNMTEVIIPDSVVGIGNEAFLDCIGLQKLIIPDSVKYIEGEAFESTGIHTVTIGKNVEVIEYSAFECAKLVEVINKSSLDITVGSDKHGGIGCYALEIHSGESKIEYIDGFVFYSVNGENYLVDYIGSLTHLTLPDNYNGESYVIKDWAFASKDLTEVVIPDSVTSIGEGAFYKCEFLAKIKYRGTQEQWADIPKGIDWDKYFDDDYETKQINYTMIYNYMGE